MSGIWCEAIPCRRVGHPGVDEPVVVGVLPGEGIGPEVVDSATAVLAAACAAGGRQLDLRSPEQPVSTGELGSLTSEGADFCRQTFAAGGAILAGPHGGRWVYDLRRRFDLFCKLSPLRPSPALDVVPGPISPRSLDGVDVLIVREQTAGIYQGRWSEADSPDRGAVAEHSFSYTRREVSRIVEVAAALAAQRRGGLAVAVKQGGIPAVSRLWRECAEQATASADLGCELLDVDFAVYRLLRDPASLDVLVAPNLFGDVLADAGAVLVGSRGVSFGASFDAAGAAVFQTNHGAAHDLAQSDRANPVGQILSAAMMLRESFALVEQADAIEQAVAATWREGWRTEDVAGPDSRVIGTAEMGERIAARVTEAAAAGAGAG
jgi:3-isopropylmalate dehydrogenase